MIVIGTAWDITIIGNRDQRPNAPSLLFSHCIDRPLSSEYICRIPTILIITRYIYNARYNVKRADKVVVSNSVAGKVGSKENPAPDSKSSAPPVPQPDQKNDA